MCLGVSVFKCVCVCVCVCDEDDDVDIHLRVTLGVPYLELLSAVCKCARASIWTATCAARPCVHCGGGGCSMCAPVPPLHVLAQLECGVYLARAGADLRGVVCGVCA